MPCVENYNELSSMCVRAGSLLLQRCVTLQGIQLQGICISIKHIPPLDDFVSWVNSQFKRIRLIVYALLEVLARVHARTKERE